MTQNNELNVVKQKVLSIVASLENMDDEKDQIKLVLESLKAEHGIEPKVARKVAKMLHKGDIQKFKDEADALEELLAKVE